MMRRLLIAAMVVFLVLLAACAPSALQAQPLNVTPPRDPCADVQCGANAYCDAGQCVCEDGFKRCGADCIRSTSCCVDTDCPPGKQCSGGVCVDRPICAFNERWDEGRKECICADGAKFCEAQGKCIPAKHCCAHSDCDDDQRCAATTYSATVCMKLDTKKCKNAHEGGIAQEFFFTETPHLVRMQKVLEGPRFDLRVNNETIRRIGINETNVLSDGTRLYVENMLVFGGNCREELD